jgi:transposase
MHYPQAAKDKAFGMYAEGLSLSEIGRRLDISSSTIHRWVSPAGQAIVQRQKEDPEYKERKKKYSRAYRQHQEHREREARRNQTPERKEYKKAYRRGRGNRERENRLRKERRATDPAFRLKLLLRSRTRRFLNGVDKSARTEELLGGSFSELVQRWNEEYGPDWQSNPDLHIDHIRPCSSFDLLDPAQQFLCCNWRNLQLLPAAENQSKGDRWRKEDEQVWMERMRESGWDGELYPVFRTDS